MKGNDKYLAFRRIVFGLTLFLIAFGCSDKSPKRSLEQRLQNIVDSQVGIDEGLLVGVSVSIRLSNDETMTITSGQSHENVPVESDMRFGVGSITKTMVAAVVMLLVEQDMLKLEDELSEFLNLDHQHIAGTISVRQLLNHTSGLDDYLLNETMWSEAEANPESSFTSSELLAYVGAPKHQPGEQHFYSNTNYLLLGMIIEAVTENSLVSVFRSSLWIPNELIATYYAAEEPIAGSIATPWRDEDLDGELETIDFPSSYHSIYNTAGAVYATATDLTDWSQQLFEGEILSRGSLNEMLTFISLDDPVRKGYGLGIRKNLLAETDFYGHTGSTRGYGAYLFYDPVSGVSMALLNNQSRSINGEKLRLQLVEELLQEVLKST